MTDETRPTRLASRTIGALALVAVALIAACGGTSNHGSSTAQPMNGATPGAPTAATVAKWPAKWCDEVHPGMARESVEQVMGAPTATFTDQESWDGFGY